MTWIEAQADLIAQAHAVQSVPQRREALVHALTLAYESGLRDGELKALKEPWHRMMPQLPPLPPPSPSPPPRKEPRKKRRT